LIPRLEELGAPRVIFVSSPTRGVGKTFFALSLALSLAIDEGARTALIDADPWPNRVSPLGLEASPGFTDLLAGRTTPREAWRHAAQLPLRVLPFGAPVDAPGTLFGSDAAAALLRETAKSVDWIVVDGPSTGGASGAGALAQRCGHVILVAASERTTRRAVREALERLGGEERASLVLNDAPTGAAALWPAAP